LVVLCVKTNGSPCFTAYPARSNQCDLLYEKGGVHYQHQMKPLPSDKDFYLQIKINSIHKGTEVLKNMIEI